MACRAIGGSRSSRTRRSGRPKQRPGRCSGAIPKSKGPANWPVPGVGIAVRLAFSRLQLVDAHADSFLIDEPVRVQLGVLRPLFWDGRVVGDGGHRALGLAGAALDALVRMDVEQSV